MKLPSLISFLKSKKSMYVSLFMALIIILSVIYFTHITYKSYKLSNESMDNKVNNADLYYFYANWCPHCKKAKEDMENIKNNFDGKTINDYIVRVRYVDCSNDSQDSKLLMSKYNVQGYPTVIMTIGEEIIEYDNKVTYNNIEEFMGDVLR